MLQALADERGEGRWGEEEARRTESERQNRGGGEREGQRTGWRHASPIIRVNADARGRFELFECARTRTYVCTHLGSEHQFLSYPAVNLRSIADAKNARKRRPHSAAAESSSKNGHIRSSELCTPKKVHRHVAELRKLHPRSSFAAATGNLRRVRFGFGPNRSEGTLLGSALPAFLEDFPVSF